MLSLRRTASGPTRTSLTKGTCKHKHVHLSRATSMDSSLAKYVSSRLCSALVTDTSRDPHASWIAAQDITRAVSEYVGCAIKEAYGDYAGMSKWHPYPKAQQVVSSTVQISAVGIWPPCCGVLYADVLHWLVAASYNSN
jgi:Tfp pilus assembly major pilin PilA